MIYRQSKNRYIVEVPAQPTFGGAVKDFLRNLRGEPELVTVDMNEQAIRILRDQMTQDLRRTPAPKK